MRHKKSHNKPVCAWLQGQRQPSAKVQVVQGLLPSSNHVPCISPGVGQGILCSVCVSRSGLHVEQGKSEGSSAQPGIHKSGSDLERGIISCLDLEPLLVAGRGSWEEQIKRCGRASGSPHLSLLCNSMQMSERIVHLSLVQWRLSFFSFLSKHVGNYFKQWATIILEKTNFINPFWPLKSSSSKRRFLCSLMPEVHISNLPVVKPLNKNKWKKKTSQIRKVIGINILNHILRPYELSKYSNWAKQHIYFYYYERKQCVYFKTYINIIYIEIYSEWVLKWLKSAAHLQHN